MKKSALALLPLTMGCFITINGKPVIPGGGAGAGGTPEPGAPGRPGPGADRAVVKLYESLTWECCVAGKLPEIDRTSSVTRPLFAAAGIPDAALKRGNPDQVWIPGWMHTWSPDYLMGVTVQAAVNRTWIARCHEDYADYRRQFAEIEAELRPEIEAAKTGTYYERRARLIGALREVDVRAAKRGLDRLSGEHPTRERGLKFALARAFVDLHRETGHEFAEAETRWRAGLDFTPLAARGSDWTDDTFERDLFCHFALEHGTHRTPAIPDVTDRDDMLVPPIAQKRRQELWDYVPTLRGPASKALTLEVKQPDVLDPDRGLDADDKRTFRSRRLVVTAVRGDGGDVVVTGSVSKGWGRQDSCKRTNRIQKIESDGRIRYEEICKYTAMTSEQVMKVTFTDLPAGVIAKGDEIEVVGDVQAFRTKKPSPRVIRNEVDLAGRFLAYVDRDKKTVFPTL